MSSHLAAGKTVELLDKLKATVEQVATRANQLNEGYHLNLVRERRKHDAEVAEAARRAAAALAEEEARFEAGKAASARHFEQRKLRIGEAYQSSKEGALRKIDEKVGGLRYEMQRRMLQAEKDREAGLAATTAKLEEFKHALAAEQETLARLEVKAQRSFAGYPGFRRLFHDAYQKAEIDGAGGEDKFLAELKEKLTQAQRELETFQGFMLLRLFRYFPLWLALAVGVFVLVYTLPHSVTQPPSLFRAVGVAVGVMFVALANRLFAAHRAKPTVSRISTNLAGARRLHDLAGEKAATHAQQELERVRNEFANITTNSDQELKRAQALASEQRIACRMKFDERTVRVTARHEEHVRKWRERLEKEHAARLEHLKQESQRGALALANGWDEKQKQFSARYAADLTELETEWKSGLQPIYQSLQESQTTAERLFPPWDDPRFSKWTPPEKFSEAAKFARLDVDVAKLCEAMPRERALALPGPGQFSVPLCLAYPEQGSILLETGNTGHAEAIGALNNILLRLLSTAPPGRLNFTILDPIGLGQNFAGIMHLADYEEQLINNRIWTQSSQIEQKLADLNEHMEKVIQMYLRNEYQTIAEYNEQAGVIAEKYYFLVVADFPANFTDTAIKRLLSIVASGARCGVYTLLHWDRRLPIPQEFMPDELRKASATFALQGQDWLLGTKARPGLKVTFDSPPTPERATELIHQIGRLSRDSSRVEVPFEQVAPADADIWSEETTTELRVPIGRTGATKFQYLAIGKGTRQHGLVAGKTGSGKSTLFHVLITNLALWCSPEQVEFYLVDFKKGVEFKCYAAKRLPHARVVAIESDREFGLSVLQRVDEELRRRGDFFRELGVQDVAGYKRAGGKLQMPRTLLLIDEFQEFFVEDDKIAQTASLLLDRIVRQGRAFGIHVLLGSQTLGGAYTVARTTLGQMVIRVALQCNEADAYLIMDENNPAPRLLSRPGEGIYNDMAGALEGNSPFQVVWLPEEVRDRYLTKVSERANREIYPGPIVFEGNAPADVRENALFRRLLEAPESQPVTSPRIWLGAPNSIKGPTEAVFQRQSGNNLLLVGQREEAILAIFSTSLLALAAQYASGNARVIVGDATPPGTPQREYLEQVVRAIPNQVTLAKPGEVAEIVKELASEMKTRAEETDPSAAPPVFLFIHGLQKFSRLRYEEDFNFSSSDATDEIEPGAALNNLICEGARLGFHVIAACDSYNNVSRFLSRKALSEFEMRVLFQMSANDSASLIDNPKAGLLGLHRALFYTSQEGYLETFRPYALPSREWLEAVAAHLARLARKSPTPA